MLTTILLLAPVSPCSELTQLATIEPASTLVADWREVHGALYPGDALPPSTAEALDRLCPDRTTCGPAHRVSAVVGAMHDPVAIVVADGEKLRVFKELSTTGGPGKARIQALGTATWVQVESESLGREPFCEKNEEGEEDCVTATVIMGHEFLDLVVEGGHIAWTATCYDDHDSPRPSQVRLDDGQVVYQACGNGKTVRFTVDHLRGCTAVNHPAPPAFPGSGTAAAPEQVTKHLNEGRKATKEKRFSDAVAAFDALLAIDPKHARARSERGFAKLVQGDLDGAERDFDQALADATDDPKLQASSWFNKGLIAEKRGNPVAAKEAFERAHQLNPSAATKKKLGLP